jgi:hypothetical protein
MDLIALWEKCVHATQQTTRRTAKNPMRVAVHRHPVVAPQALLVELERVCALLIETDPLLQDGREMLRAVSYR